VSCSTASLHEMRVFKKQRQRTYHDYGVRISQSCEETLIPFFHHCVAIILRLEQTNQDSVHDPDFRQSEKDWHGFVEKLTERLVEIDDTVPELPVKDIVRCLVRDPPGYPTADERHRSSAFIGMSASPKIPPHTRCVFASASKSARGVSVTASPRPSHACMLHAGCTLKVIACFANARAKPFFSAAWYAVRGVPPQSGVATSIDC
jgi:hypothetical protein